MSRKKQDARTMFKIEFTKSKDVHILTDEELKRLQAVELDILKDFLKVVEENHIPYTLSGGSVLGTIRHGGFIPWDDDVDINMTRASYNRFCEVFAETLGTRYELWAPELGHEHGLAHVQIKKKNTVYQSFNELSKENNGIYLDVFIVENVPDNALLRKMHGFLCLAVGYMLTCRKTYYDMPYLEKYIGDSQMLRKTLMKKARIGRFFAWLSLDRASKITSRVYSMCRNSKSKYVTIPSGRKHYFGELQLRKDLCETVEKDFAGVTVKIPKGYKNYMEGLYGKDYMTIPPVEAREQHPLMKLDFGDDRTE